MVSMTKNSFFLHFISSRHRRSVFKANPFTCQWLVEEIFASKNVHYGRDYVVRSRHDLFEATGVACTDQHTSTVQRLVVLETRRDVNDDDAVATMTVSVCDGDYWKVMWSV